MLFDEKNELSDFIARAIWEDLRDGDHTSLACIPAEARGKAKLLVKDTGVLAGIEVSKHIFNAIAPDFQVDYYLADGDEIRPGDIAFEVEGRSQTILQAERLVLNTMQRMSGIATITRRYVDAIAGLPVTLLDTRKTTPTLRFLEKWAVRIGGGTNYRNGLYDRIMIKDNHVDFCGNIGKAIEQVHAYLKEKGKQLEITVEVRNFQEIDEAMAVGGFQRIMLDNFEVETMRRAVEHIGGRYEIEASGGITLETLRSYAETGVDFISVGALTHSFQSLDLSLKKVR